MPLLQPAPVLMKAIELHVASKQLPALIRSDLLALLHDLLADSQPIPNRLPSLLDRGQSTVGRDHLITSGSHACITDCLFVSRLQVDRDKEHANAKTNARPQLFLNRAWAIMAHAISQSHNPLGAIAVTEHANR